MRLRLISIFLLALGSSAIAQTITYGPILGRGVTPDRMIVRWGTTKYDDTTKLYVRPQGAEFFTIQAGFSARDHQVELQNLSLDRVYEYYVESGETRSDLAQFRTCPRPGQPMDLIFYGDSRDGSTTHKRIVDLVADKKPEMVFETGDIRVDGKYAGYLAEFFPVVKSLVATTPFMAAPGNHDDDAGLANNYGLLFPIPRTTLAESFRAYYSFVCGNAQFIALDSNRITDSAQLDFLKSQLASARDSAQVDHVFVWFHHSAYSPGEGHGDNSSVQKTWVPLFDRPENKVSAVFSGHDHVYARMDDGSEVAYIVTGGAGADLKGTSRGSQAKTVVAKSAYHFVHVRVLGPNLEARVFSDSNAELDRFSLIRQNDDGGANQDAAPSDAAESHDGNADGASGAGCSVTHAAEPPLLAAGLVWLLLYISARRLGRKSS